MIMINDLIDDNCSYRMSVSNKQQSSVQFQNVFFKELKTLVDKNNCPTRNYLLKIILHEIYIMKLKILKKTFYWESEMRYQCTVIKLYPHLKSVDGLSTGIWPGTLSMLAGTYYETKKGLE